MAATSSKDLLTELIIMTIIIIACAVGPVILINAQFSYFFIISGVVFTIYCIFISKLITKVSLALFTNKLNLLWVGMVFGFIPFITMSVFQNWGNPHSLLRISKQDAFFSFPVIMGICTFMMIFILLRGSSLRTAVFKSGMGFLFPIMLTILILPLISNSEGKVLLGNVVVIYFTLKFLLMISPYGQATMKG